MAGGQFFSLQKISCCIVINSHHGYPSGMYLIGWCWRQGNQTQALPSWELTENDGWKSREINTVLVSLIGTPDPARKSQYVKAPNWPWNLNQPTYNQQASAISVHRHMLGCFLTETAETRGMPLTQECQNIPGLSCKSQSVLGLTLKKFQP